MELSELRKYGELMKELKLSAFEISEGGRTFRMERNRERKRISAYLFQVSFKLIACKIRLKCLIHGIPCTFCKCERSTEVWKGLRNV